jgi:hypothetical protein
MPGIVISGLVQGFSQIEAYGRLSLTRASAVVKRCLPLSERSISVALSGGDYEGNFLEDAAVEILAG